MTEKALVTNLILKTQDTIAPLREVATTAKGTDDAMAAMADSTANAIEELVADISKANVRLGDTGKVSQQAFDSMLHAADAVRDEIVERFGSIEAAPAAFQNAVHSAQNSLQGLGTAIEQAKQGTAGLREEFTRGAEEVRRLAEEQKRAAELIEEVNEKYGDTAKKIDDIRAAADQTSDEQEKGLRAIQEELKDAAAAYTKMGTAGKGALDQLKVEAQRVETAIAELAKESEGGSRRIADGFVLAARQSEALERAVRTGNPQMREELVKTLGVQIALKHEIEATRGSVDKALPEEIAQYRKLEAQIAKSKGEVTKFTTEMQQQGVNLTGQWNGLGGALGTLSPKMASLVSVAGQFAAAIGTIAAVSTAWHNAAGTDMTATASLWSDLTDRARNYQDALWDLDPAVDNIHRMTAALRLSKEEFAALKVAEEITGKSIDDYREKMTTLREVHDSEAKAHQAGILAQKLWNAAKKEAAGDIDKVAEAGKRLNPVFDVMAKFIAEGSKGEKLWSDLHITHTTTIEQLRVKLAAAGIDVAKLKEHFDKVKEAEAGAKEAHEAYLESLGKTEQAVTELTKTLNTEKSALDDANRAKLLAQGEVRRLSEIQRDLNEQYAAEEAGLRASGAARGESSATLEALKARLADVTAEMAEQQAKASAAASSESSLAASVREHTTELTTQNKALKANSDEITAIVSKLQERNLTQRTLSDEDAKQIARLKELRDGTIGLTDAERALIDGIAELKTAKAEISDATGKVIQVSLLEQESVRQDLHLKSEKLLKLRAEATANDETRNSVDRLAEARRRDSEATSAGGEIQLKWTDETKQGQLTAAAAADTMRRLKDAHTDAGAAAETGGEKVTGLATKLPAVTGEAAKAATAVRDVGEATVEASDKAAPAADALGRLFDAIRPGEIAATVGAVRDLRLEIEGLAIAADKAEGAIRRLNSTAADSAGADGGDDDGGAISYTNVTESA